MAKSTFDPAAMISSVEDAGYTRSHFARLAGVDRSTITRLAHGEIRRPSYEMVEKLRSAFAKVSPPQQK